MTHISETKIANLALSHIGQRSTIESLEEESAEAGECDLWYDFSRTEALKAFNWTFARKRITLALHGDAAPDEWGFRYQYPADCLVVRLVPNPAGPNADAVPYEVEISGDNTKSILTNLESATAIYTFNQQTTEFFTPFFIKVLSYLLASYIAFALTGKRSLRADMVTKFDSEILKAPAHDANEGQKAPAREAEWIRARA